jgi:hypothetical protein
MKKLKPLKMERDYWFPRYGVNSWGRKKSICKIFDLEYDDSNDIFSNGQVLWGSNTAQRRRTYTIPVGKTNKKSALKSLKSLMKRYK